MSTTRSDVNRYSSRLAACRRPAANNARMGSYAVDVKAPGFVRRGFVSQAGTVLTWRDPQAEQVSLSDTSGAGRWSGRTLTSISASARTLAPCSSR